MLKKICVKKIWNNDSKKINHMALPMILNNVSTKIIELCDQAMVGRISLASFATVGLVETTINSITGVLGMTSVAFNILGARCKGEKNHSELNNNFIINIIMSIILGIVFFLGALCFGSNILKHFYSLNNEVLKESSNYLNVFSISIGLNMILFIFSSYLRIMDKTKYILYGNVTSLIANVVFDYILIFGKLGFPRLGMIGNAIGSVLALLLNLIFYILIFKKYKFISEYNISFIKIAKETIKISIPLMGQEVLESTILVIVINSILAHIGILEVSVYNLLYIIIGIALMPMYSYSQASLTIINENIGAENKPRVKDTPKKCLFFAMIFYFAISATILILRDYIPIIITNNENLIINTVKFIPFIVFVSVLNIPYTIYKYSLQGIGDEKWVFLYSVIINFIGMVLIYILALILNLKLYGVYVGMLLNYIILSIVFVIRYIKKNNESLC